MTTPPKSAHTKGKLRLIPAYNFGLSKTKDPSKDDLVLANSADGPAIALIYRDNAQDEYMANVLLAAQDLLEALKQARIELGAWIIAGSPKRTLMVLEQVNAAIQKAESS